MAKKKQSYGPSSLITSLPEDVIIDILARVPRCDYPTTLTFVCKHFRSIVASPELYARRSLLGRTEQCLYVILYNKETNNNRWYILHQKANGSRRLVLIRTLPGMTWRGRFVTVGSKIYVFGESNRLNNASNALRIDCQSHTVHPLPNIPVDMTSTFADIIDGRIYVFGYCQRKKKVIVVFNTETQMWEHGVIKPDIELGHSWLRCVVVMADKLYMRDNDNSFVYEPNKKKWETDDVLNLKEWDNACVIDDVLYYPDIDKKKIRAYDPKQKCWRVVKGLEESLPNTENSWWWLETVSYGGRLALLFFPKAEERTTETWCAEISLERRQGGEIWGKVEWFDHVLTRNY
ncbi:hypothetical protein EUTSA_v10017832mg [Eutrema salsugineum]|uniref:F-box domain-containing protein n=1 Tax=Eutrema salsugineum TaxID=72664 RepID=V4LLX9_EUTSA|nr:F-box/kelch-repeat protein At4g38940 [Eutrema salsugineum]ESQ51520.1 hypothetical protein EUTSA_v10017832mg [Eutrema salsugineum]